MIHPVDVEPSQGYGDNPTKNLPASSWIIQQFGNYQPDGHTGIDYPVPVGTPVRAVTSGKVLHVGYYTGSYSGNEFWIAPSFAGWCYVIDHGAFIGIYAHGQEGGARVAVGEQVAEGQVIGLSGNTGGSTGPHLHFEILLDGFVVNSYMYGRSNPATIFNGLAPMGAITQEDELSAADVERIINEITINMEAKHKVTRQAVNDARDSVNFNTQKQVEGVGRVTQQLILDNASPTDIAAAIPANIVQDVLDGLAKRLVK
jgi:murein DD-endopeptidase MepM/ murein hydrolase activator NlpD